MVFEHNLNLTIYLCSQCMRVHNSHYECYRHEITAHGNTIVQLPSTNVEQANPDLQHLVHATPANAMPLHNEPEKYYPVNHRKPSRNENIPATHLPAKNETIPDRHEFSDEITSLAAQNVPLYYSDTQTAVFPLAETSTHCVTDTAVRQHFTDEQYIDGDSETIHIDDDTLGDGDDDRQSVVYAEADVLFDGVVNDSTTNDGSTDAEPCDSNRMECDGNRTVKVKDANVIVTEEPQAAINKDYLNVTSVEFGDCTYYNLPYQTTNMTEGRVMFEQKGNVWRKMGILKLSKRMGHVWGCYSCKEGSFTCTFYLVTTHKLSERSKLKCLCFNPDTDSRLRREEHTASCLRRIPIRQVLIKDGVMTRVTGRHVPNCRHYTTMMVAMQHSHRVIKKIATESTMSVAKLIDYQRNVVNKELASIYGVPHGTMKVSSGIAIWRRSQRIARFKK